MDKILKGVSMSVVLNLVRSSYSIIATDSRIMLDKVGRYTDVYPKLYPSNIGWVSGTGVGEFIRYMANNLSGSPYETYKKYIRSNKDYSKEDLEKTLISYSYIYRNETRIKYLGQEYCCVKIPKETPTAFPPADLSEELHNEIYDELIKRLKNSEHLDDDIYTIANYISDVSQSCKSVSSICDFGIIDRRLGKSERVNIREDFSLFKTKYDSNSAFY